MQPKVIGKKRPFEETNYNHIRIEYFDDEFDIGPFHDVKVLDQIFKPRKLTQCEKAINSHNLTRLAKNIDEYLQDHADLYDLLSFAIQKNDSRIVDYLISTGKSDFFKYNGDVLTQAFECKHFEIFKLLVAKLGPELVSIYSKAHPNKCYDKIINFINEI